MLWTTTTTTNPLMFGVNLSKEKERFNREKTGDREKVVRSGANRSVNSFNCRQKWTPIVRNEPPSTRPLFFVCLTLLSNCSYETANNRISRAGFLNVLSTRIQNDLMSDVKSDCISALSQLLVFHRISALLLESMPRITAPEITIPKTVVFSS